MPPAVDNLNLRRKEGWNQEKAKNAMNTSRNNQPSALNGGNRIGEDLGWDDGRWSLPTVLVQSDCLG